MIGKNQIIGYYDYFYDQYEYSRMGSVPAKVRQDSTVTDIDKFFYNDKVCPFCKTNTKTVFVGIQSGTYGNDIYFSGDVLECPNCNWWTYKTHFSDSDDSINTIKAIYTDTRHYAIAKQFNVDDKNLPIDILTTELKKKSELLYSIDPYKLEELSQSILQGIYNCDVHHVGKTGDGGVDLLVLESDDPILVQVKRRQSPSHVELVKGVREFVGTLFIEDKRKGIYISTASKFSKGSKDIAHKLLSNRKLDYFELIDYDKLCSLINKSSDQKPWGKLVENFYSSSNSCIYDTEESINKLNKH